MGYLNDSCIRNTHEIHLYAQILTCCTRRWTRSASAFLLPSRIYSGNCFSVSAETLSLESPDFSTISKIFAKFRQNSIKLWEKFNDFFRKRVNFVKCCRKMRKSLTKMFWNIEVWAVQKHVNLVDLVKSFPTKIFLQNLASIQQRTIKFDHLDEKSD